MISFSPIYSNHYVLAYVNLLFITPLIMITIIKVVYVLQTGFSFWKLPSLECHRWSFLAQANIQTTVRHS